MTWDIDIPVANHEADAFRQIVLDNWNQAAEDGFQEAINLEEVARQRAENALWGRQPDEEYDYDEDIESQMAEYAEYQRELDMEEYSGRHGR